MNRLKPDRPSPNRAMSPETAQDIAIGALAFLAGDADLLHRFVGVTGIEPQHMRAAAREPGFLAGVLDFLLAHEPTAAAFCENAGLDGESVAAAARVLGGGQTGKGS